MGLGSVPAWGSLLWIFWRGHVRPRLIPAHQIETDAVQMITHYGDDAFERAITEEDRAWRYSDSFEQGRWRRVSLEIMRIKTRRS
jgi:hypothetical protein